MNKETSPQFNNNVKSSPQFNNYAYEGLGFRVYASCLRLFVVPACVGGSSPGCGGESSIYALVPRFTGDKHWGESLAVFPS